MTTPSPPSPTGPSAPAPSAPGRGLAALHAQGITALTRAFIGGAYVDAASGRTFADLSPIDGSLLAEVAACDSADIDSAVAAARAAFDDGRWRDQPPRARQRVIYALADLVEQHAEELALLETVDVGKPIADALNVDIPAAANTLRWYAEAIDKVYDEIAPTGPGALALITREPIGVVAAIVPWNFPLYMATWKLGPALATGNSVVLKPSERSPLTALRLGQLAIEAGLPDGVLNVVPGYGSTAGQALGRHRDVDAITFTGSTAVGKLLMTYAGESNLKRVSLELGGKSPQIVLPDAPDLDTAARSAVQGIFFNQGQVCNAGSRLLVHRAVRDEFLERILRLTADLHVADPLDPATRYGALVDHAHLKAVQAHLQRGQAEGATLAAGGQQLHADTGGAYLAPTVFTDVRPEMHLAQEEIFGPVLSVLEVTDVEHAITVANDSRYGLAAAVWTRDLDTALTAAKRLRAGVVWINNFDESDITTPWGGFKQSGTGRDKSLHALHKYTELKTTWIKVQAPDPSVSRSPK